MNNSDSFGLRTDDIETIRAILAQYPAVETALVFGSRAKGNYKRGSDVDLALRGAELTERTAAQIAYYLNEETIMPYHFDVLTYSHIANPALRAHIDRVGREIYVNVPTRIDEMMPAES